jgi:AcrR family transcriptional regulator
MYRDCHRGIARHLLVRYAVVVEPVPTGLRERRIARTKAEILAVAFDLFEAEGFDAVTSDQIARSAEVSPRTFFRYFDSKSDLVFAGFAGLVDHIVAALEALTTEVALTDAVLLALTDAFLTLPNDDVVSLQRAATILRNAESLRSAAVSIMPKQEERIAVALQPWLHQVDPIRSLYLATTFTIALWMVIGQPVESQRISRKKRAAKYAADTVLMLETWSQSAARTMLPD